MNFYKRVSFVCKRIPFGHVATYGQISKLCGKPANSRQVGYALNMGLAGKIPAHRVVNSCGFLSGAKAFENEYEQKRLLMSEGVFVDDRNKVNLKQFIWKTGDVDIFWFGNCFNDMDI